MMNRKWFDLTNRPMILEDIEYIKRNRIAQEIFTLVDTYAKEGLMICNGHILANNLTDGQNHIKTASIYRLWEYVSLIELVGLHTLMNSEERSLRILDCGGCSSAVDFYLAEKGFQVCSIDLNEYLVFNSNFIAQKKQLPLTNVKADMTKLPFADDSFDIVFSISVLEHIEKKLRFLALREMERIVSPGGFIFNTFDYGEYESIVDIKGINDIMELLKPVSSSRVAGNPITSDLDYLPKTAPAHGEYIIYLDLGKSFNAFTNPRDVGRWLIRFLMFKLFPQRAVRIYSKNSYYNFFRLLLRKE